MRRGETSLQILAVLVRAFTFKMCINGPSAYQDQFLVISYNALSAVCVETSHKPQAKPMAWRSGAPCTGEVRLSQHIELLFFLIHIHPSTVFWMACMAKMKSPCSFGYNMDEIKEPQPAHTNLKSQDANAKKTVALWVAASYVENTQAKSRSQVFWACWRYQQLALHIPIWLVRKINNSSTQCWLAAVPGNKRGNDEVGPFTAVRGNKFQGV